MPHIPTSSPPQDARPHVLVVDDEPGIRELVQRYFDANGFRVTGAGDGTAARAVLALGPVDLVLLDVGLPGEDGLTLTRYLREHWHGAVIIVSGRGDPIERIVGLEIGADDYVSKPFELRELLARARSVLRRVQSTPAPASTPENADRVYEFLGMRLERESRRLVGADGVDIGLTTGEFDLLCALVEQPNRVLSRDQLMERIHGRAAGPYDRGIDVQIGRLRQKVEPDPGNPSLIKSVRGAGYLFAAPVTRHQGT